MLVLSRKCGEELSLNGGQITVRVCQIKGGKVRLAIAAPANVDIFRGEVWERIKIEEQEQERDDEITTQL